jgi:hypothetical protein
MRQSTNALSRSKFIVSALAASAIVAMASNASAQEVSGSTPVAPTTPPAVQTATTAAAAGAGGLDHDRHVNQLGLRYFGAVAAPAAMGMATTNIHNVGVRYWISRTIGIEAGVGLALNVAAATRFGFALTGGVPINLAATQHLAIHLIPNIVVGIPNVDPFFFTVLFGADAAAELSFGFIGVPQMSLQARMGLNVGLAIAGGNAQFALGTTAGSGSNVWDVIAGSVSATYYFGR